MDGSLETVEAVRSVREGMGRKDRRSVSEWLGRIRTRVAMVSVLLLAVAALQAWNGLNTNGRQAQLVEELGVRQRGLDAAVDAFAASVASYGAAFSSIVAGAGQSSAAAARMAPQTNLLASSFRRVEELLGPGVDPAVIGAARDMLARLPDLAERSRQVSIARRRADFAPLHEEWLDAQAAFNRLAEAARDVLNRRHDASLRRAEEGARHGRFMTIAAAGLGIAAAALVWVVLAGAMTRPLGALAQVMIRIARGDVAADVPMTGREDQVGQIARAARVLRDNLNVIRSLADRALDGARQAAAATAQASGEVSRVAEGAVAQLAELRAIATALSYAAELLGLAGRTAQEASERAAEVGASAERLERLLNETGRLAGAAAQSVEQQRASVQQLAERLAALARIAQSNATAAEQATVTMVELSRLAGDTRDVVEAVASGARNGRNL